MEKRSICFTSPTTEPPLSLYQEGFHLHLEAQKNPDLMERNDKLLAAIMMALDGELGYEEALNHVQKFYNNWPAYPANYHLDVGAYRMVAMIEKPEAPQLNFFLTFIPTADIWDVSRPAEN